MSSEQKKISNVTQLPPIQKPSNQNLEEKPDVPVQFQVTLEQLLRIVSFDDRANPEQVKFLNSKFGGVIGLARLLATNLDSGLKLASDSINDNVAIKTSAVKSERAEPIDAPQRRKAFGVNIVPPQKSESIFSIVIGTIREDPIIKILIISSAVTLIIGSIVGQGWVEGLAILIAVTIVLTVTAGNDYSKDKKFKKLILLQSDKKTKVIRSGIRDTVSSWDLLVGDIVELCAGDEVPADGIFVEGTRLIVDESPLTGESIPLKKSSKSLFLFSGCHISEGAGLMLITSVGPSSAGGQIQLLINQSQNHETVLQTKLRKVAVFIGKIGFSAGIITFLGLTIRHIVISVKKYAPPETYPNKDLLNILSFFNVSVTVIVVAVPEGLPLAVTISLAFSMFKMIRDRCFVRHLDASETMGEATVICTDKTGTLTENKMTVVRIILGNIEISGEGSGDVFVDEAKKRLNSAFPDNKLSDSNEDSRKTQNLVFTKGSLDLIYSNQMTDLVCESVCINSTCYLKEKNDQNTTSQNISSPAFIGSATEGALLVFARKLGYDYDLIRKKVLKIESGDYLFTSDRKRMSVICEPEAILAKSSASRPLFRLYTKGASETVLNLCISKISPGATRIDPMEKSDISIYMEVISKWASEGLRTIAIAFRDFDRPLTRSEREDPERDLTLIGIFGIKDPVRPMVPEAVRACQNAGIVVRMVTGDNILTASKISRECNILSERKIKKIGQDGEEIIEEDDNDELVMEGPVFRALSMAEKRAVAPRLRVLARSSPADKHALVCLLKELGEVVAVTGDGTNDAAALKEADVGFAMGISGTQIAINASDIVLMDDNFVSIVQAIKWGRNVLDVVRKFLQFQLSVNLTAVTITIVGSLSMQKSPLDPVQLLWVNLIMDTFGALGLASDLPDENILKRRPHSRNELIITPSMKQYIFFQTVYQVFVLLLILFNGRNMINYDSSIYGEGDDNRDAWLRTIVFNSFVLMQITNEVTTRQLDHEIRIFRGIFRNRLFSLMLLVILVVQILLVQFAGALMGTFSLGLYEWAICILAALLSLIYMVIVRVFFKIWRQRIRRHRVVHDGGIDKKYKNTSNNENLQDFPKKEKKQIAPKLKILQSSEIPRSPAGLADC